MVVRSPGSRPSQIACSERRNAAENEEEGGLLKKTTPNRTSDLPYHSPGPFQDCLPSFLPEDAGRSAPPLRSSSTTCRPIILFASENAIEMDFQLVDLLLR